MDDINTKDKKKEYEKRCIEKYYELQGKEVYISENVILSLFKMPFNKTSDVVISNNRLIRLFGKIKNLDRNSYDDAAIVSEQFMALLDAANLLNGKGISVYFYNRIGKKKDYTYSTSETFRMSQGLNFPIMYQDIPKYRATFEEILGDLYSDEYVDELGKISQVIRVGSEYRHEDINGKLVNVINGKRITKHQPQDAKSKIHIYGRCGAFGYAVDDGDTIPSLLQKELVDHGICDYKVINHGLWGGGNDYLDHNFLQDVSGIKPGDIVIFYRLHFADKLMEALEREGVRYRNITDEWHTRKNEKVTFYDKPGHMNAEGYKVVAKILFEDLIENLFNSGNIVGNSDDDKEHIYLNKYLENRVDVWLEDNIKKYIEEIDNKYPIGNNLNNGAIVMNCNPFTKGHRYLIETAAKKVDRLYIFVVEENKSVFLFEDRFKMVKDGIKDLENIVVIPSGEFIISAFTFPEYFMKDYVKEKSFDVSKDVTVFGRYIAPPLKIKKRFAGEEPFDPVTKNYNENMAEILPQYGIEFLEIPRMKVKNSEEQINATRVRELMKSNDIKALEKYLPDTTINVVKTKYME